MEVHTPPEVAAVATAAEAEPRTRPLAIAGRRVPVAVVAAEEV